MRASFLAAAILVAALSPAMAAGECDMPGYVAEVDAEGVTTYRALAPGEVCTDRMAELDAEADLGGVSVAVDPKGSTGDLAGVKDKVLKLAK